MQEVHNKEGIKVDGLYRSNLGVLIVNNPKEYDKYQKQKHFINHQRDKILSLENEIENLKNLVNQLIKNQNG